MDWKQKQDMHFMNWMREAFQKKQKKARVLLGLDPVNDNKPLPWWKVAPKVTRVWDSCYDTYVYRTVANKANNKAKPEEKSSVFSSSSEFGRALVKKGYQRLGSGAFSIVYAHPKSDRVIKVTRTADNWIDYALWAAKNGYAGNFAPKVYSFKKFTKGQEFLVSVVERMDKTMEGSTFKEDTSLVTPLLKYYANYRNVTAGVFLDDLVPGFAHFTDQLNKNFGRLDIHDGNIMVRKDGTVCFTDPVSDYAEGQVTHKRLKASDFTSLATAKRLLAKAIERYNEEFTMAVLPKVSLVLVR